VRVLRACACGGGVYCRNAKIKRDQLMCEGRAGSEEKRFLNFEQRKIF
jgi:hypothetical protein